LRRTASLDGVGASSTKCDLGSDHCKTDDGYDGWGLLDINTRNLEERPNFSGSKGVIAATMNRHHGRYNITFCDGHTETIKRAKLFEETDTSLQRWNNDNQPHANSLMAH